MRDLSSVIFRGEHDGKLKVEGGNRYPFFFTESYEQAKLYAGRGTEPIACVIQAATVLDLTKLDYRNSVHQKLMSDASAEFDDWTDRISGEPRDLGSYLEAGDLYDYEGTGSGQRWRSLLSFALETHDAVRVLDVTDGTGGRAVPVWVTADRKNIRHATFGEQLASALEHRPWPEIERWLHKDHPGLIERIKRLRMPDDDYRLENLGQIMPAGERAKINYSSGHLALWRASPKGTEIRPGDWVALNQDYAQLHEREPDNGRIQSLLRVAPGDVYWSGTDHQEFFFLPSAWRIEASSTEAYLKALSSEQVRMLCDGEGARLTRNQQNIESLIAHVRHAASQSMIDKVEVSDHGPDHWSRVSEHARVIARSLGVDPLVPYLFALVHDSQRQDEFQDLEHGPRAAQFIETHRSDFFGFLTDSECRDLAFACEQHSMGGTEPDELVVRACWDADRLDLWRVGIEPEPMYLCTSYAKNLDVIDEAREFLISADQPQNFGPADLDEEPIETTRHDSLPLRPG